MVEAERRGGQKMSGLNGEWYEALKGEFSKPYYRKLFETVNEEYRTKLIFPPAQDIFNAFHLTPLKDVKVVILGQDPYHNNGQAHGLSFSVQKGVDIPPSLVNIYKELHDDLGCTIPNHGCLTKWAEQGVLMLNTVLTVRAHQAIVSIVHTTTVKVNRNSQICSGEYLLHIPFYREKQTKHLR